MSDFVEVKTADLIGDALDWAIAQVQGFEPTVDSPMFQSGLIAFGLRKPADWMPINGLGYSPSKLWLHGGPLIEEWDAQIYSTDDNEGHPARWGAIVIGARSASVNGPTPLVALCRAIVYAKFGGSVDVPKVLSP